MFQFLRNVNKMSNTGNYVNKLSIYGLMNSNCKILVNKLGFWKTKNHNKLVLCEDNIDDVDLSNTLKISMMYLDKVNHNKEFWNSNGYEMSKITETEEIFSYIDKDFFNKLNRTNNKEVYETLRKYDNWKMINKMFVVDYSDDIYDDILIMIKEWATTSGKKYGFLRHDGIDKAFFKRLKDKEINKDLYDIRIYKIEDKVVGYSVIEHNSSFENNGYIYLIRKSLIDYRNLCLYIDYDTFREKLNYENNIIVNWGCSSGGVKKYKLSKFKLAYIKKLYFYNLNKKQS